MIARMVRLTVWLGLGAAVLSGVFWLFLSTPETNVLALGTSAALLILLLVLAALITNAAVLIGAGASVAASVARGLRGTAWFVVTLIPLALVWWALTVGHDWVVAHSGEINAWFIARFGWADVSALMTAEVWAVRWLGWVVAPLAAVSLLSALLHDGARGVGGAWLRRAWHWRTLLLATIVFVLFFVLPWQLTTWRPAVPATWIEPTVAGLRLFAVMLLSSVGAALLILLSVSSRAVATPPAIAAEQP